MFDGKWDVTMSTPMGPQQMSMDLSTSGSVLSGSVSGAQGSNEFSDGKVDGNSGEWAMDITSPMGPMNLQFSGTVDGDKISGTVKLGSFGDATFEGSRSG